ncbi:glycoside hydrolase family 2 TIM barrel-domain containing protein [Snuella sedimenti]|uniref:Beta-galactosidase n=1 Tax=Snuella sedimenti TaxID=2798802 RepID=A0A8J7IWW8_9FLAO|nr:glycoside hydrolase family 2 TIM barrel-domain containing protein [Snuella sedimenti]MBJ6368635.1 hypothetical protein [Snuella sedimenti]
MKKYKITFLSVIVCLVITVDSYTQEKMDHFAKIGNMVSGTRLHLLEQKVPKALPEEYLPVANTPSAAFKPIHSMDTADELKEELLKFRKQFVPFMDNKAPELKTTRIKIPLTEFSWREETSEDVSNFTETLKGKGQWEKVQMPHFGPPRGRAVTYYFKTFVLTQEMLDKGSLFSCFRAVDYKASVFINGALQGTHEGMFAPFEFNFTKHAKLGENTILVKVESDYNMTGSNDLNGVRVYGDKIFTGTGVGYDDPETGWHIADGMGIYQDCYIEARENLHINDTFVRPLLEKQQAEIWLEVNNFYEVYKEITAKIAVFGQNFKATVVPEFEYKPSTKFIQGIGDLDKPNDGKQKFLKMGYGKNYLKLTVDIKDPKIWNNQTPWLYQLQVKLFDGDKQLTDTKKQQFGMRSFTMDTISVPKGTMYLNGNKIRLRGANTMGFLQVDVKNKDWNQLIDDILLAKICNMNFLRLTQRPVQPEIYEYCDKLGLMTQTDLPLFGGVRPNKWAEIVKQAGEMERLVRNHPSNIMITYMNERFPNGEGFPQRQIGDAEGYMKLYKACDQAVLMANPDRVIKSSDGDYDPPSPGLPDSHCYNGWYNGHGLGLGELHKGYWQYIKTGWFYGCGEFGAEGLDNYSVMEKYYPASWLPQSKAEEKTWNANWISKAQTHRFHYMWFNTQDNVKDWIEASQTHQAWATKLTTESFRRNSDMVSFAIHLFIDAWPAGWMKTIMDVDRQPKKAFFTYRDALKPLMASLRTDRYHFYSGEALKVEAWLCNDLNKIPENYTLKYQLEKGKRIVFSNKINAKFAENASQFQGYINRKLPEVNKRTSFLLRLALFDENGKGISESTVDLEVFPNQVTWPASVYATKAEQNIALPLLDELKVNPKKDYTSANTIIIDHFGWYLQHKDEIDDLVHNGKKVVFMELEQGDYSIAKSHIKIENTAMGSYYFVSPQTDHPMVKDNKPNDFKFWYDESKDLVSPFLSTIMLLNKDWNPILLSGNTNWIGDKGGAFAVAEMNYGKGTFTVCQLQLNHRLSTNPVAKTFVERLLKQ